MTPTADPQELERFLGTARWFGGKGRPFRVADVRRAGELGGAGGPWVAVDLVRVAYLDDEGGEELYQLPLSLRAAPQEHLEHALVGTAQELHLYDAVHDKEAMELWLTAFGAEPGRKAAGGGLSFHRLPGPDLTGEPAALLGVEQSNSSVAYGEEALMKLFRRVTPGVNPDVHVHEVLTRDGCEHVAALYGWVELADEHSGDVIQLAMLQQFLRTASDGWDLARASVRNLYAEGDLHAHEVGGDFAAESSRLGVALAETHAALASVFDVGETDLAALADTLSQRLDAAADVVAELATYADRLRPALRGVAGLGVVPAQRIHGDLHLGQTLRTVKGWKLVDFEGEPSRPLADRALPEPVWRDVAGMLRSFDYAAAVVALELDSAEPAVADQRRYRAAEWSTRNREAFLDGYTSGRGLTATEQALLDAFEVDKAAYECVYEARNRPDWIGIPLTAVRRLAGESTPRMDGIGAE